ncbi:uncharacterized protein OCT59_003746 [Rhizophagus irregularis]|uniref:uncharacterized protein n=1 Tax=Rhizophagus irregularis TaxID=588596 RepID=UPI000CA96530|nr:hypothetical protein OCT59_003746 [Rhizophagus irregularis]
MSTSARTTRSAAQKGIDNQEQGETMEGVVGTTSSAQDTSNNFTFTPNDEEFTTVKSKATLRQENKKKKKQQHQAAASARLPYNRKQQATFKRQELDPFVAYNPQNTQQKKKTKPAETPKNVDPIVTQSTSATPTANKGKANEDHSDVLRKINTQDQDDQSMQDDSHFVDPSADNQLPEKEMADAESSPIVLSKHNTWKATCTIPEAPKSTQFCHYIVKIIKSKIDVVTTFEEKKPIKMTDDTSQEQKYCHVISIKVNTEVDLNSLCNMTFKMPSATDGDENNVVYSFKKVDNLQEKRKQLFQSRESRTIKVFNIPLYMENYNLKAVFSRYGELEEDGITTRLKGIYRQAFITYKDELSVQPFYAQWSVWAFKECLSVVPVLLSDDKKSERFQFAAKINGLPFNTCARDLQPLVTETSAASIFIPRNPVTYKPMKYAFVYFRNDKDFSIATNNVYEYEGQQLEWSPLDTKSCHRCGYTGHVAKECQTELRQRSNKLNRNQLLQQFKNRNKSKFNSYADATKGNRYPNNRQRHWNQNNIINRQRNNNTYTFSEEEMQAWGDEEDISDNNHNPIQGGTRKGGSMHEPNNNTHTSSQNDLSEIKKQLTTLNAMITEFRKENDIVRKEINSIKETFKNNNNRKGLQQKADKLPIVNDNNKRAKPDSSSSENDDNNLVLNLESRVEKQDSLLNNMFNMITKLTGQLSDKEQNDSTTNKIASIGGTSNAANQFESTF